MKNINKSLFLTLSWLLTPFWALAHYGDDFYGHYMDMGFGFFGGGFFMLLFWVLVIFGVLYLLKKLVKSEEKGDRFMEILKERYAKGEISKEEFEEKKKELQ